MKKIICGLLLTVLLASYANAQKSPITFGEIPLDDLKMTTYLSDTSASAVILADYGEAYLTINSNYATMHFERHVRIKILKKEGLSWADAEILLYNGGSSEERVTKSKATTYTLENGRVVKTEMDKEGVFKEKFNKRFNVQKFTMPNVKEGSVIEYSYTILSPYVYNFPNWQFQYNIPVRWSEYWAKLPDFFTFEKYMQGYISPTKYEVKKESASGYTISGHHWIIQDVPAFKEEPFITTEEDYLSKMNFALAYINFPGQPTEEIMGTWSKLNANLLEDEDFGKIITGSGFLKKKAEELTAGLTTPADKMKAIYAYVQQTLEWDGTKDIYADQLKKVFEVKKGTAADINLALAALLDRAGLTVDPVLLSTRDHGFIREQYPMSRQFNYVVCRVQDGDKTYLLDATNKYLAPGVLPDYCLNGQGLIISATRHGWMKIDPKVKAKTSVSTDLRFDESGTLLGTITYSCDGYEGERVRNQYYKMGEQEYVKKFLNEKKLEGATSTFENLADITQPVKHKVEVTLQNQATSTGNIIYINPFGEEAIKENLFKLEERVYPVDFGKPLEKTYVGKIAVPDGYTIDELPQTKMFVIPNGGGKYTFSTSVTKNIISIVSILQINKTLFTQVEYPLLREFYNQVVAKQAEQIVLKKI